MNHFDSFVFEGYDFNAFSHELILHYSLDRNLHFKETYIFDFDFVPYDQAALDLAIESLFLMAGVSYYKAFLPQQIELGVIQLSADDAAFYTKTYQKGLGEFFYVNHLDPHTQIPFKTNSSTNKQAQHSSNNGLLIGIGGGKDSLLSVEALRNSQLPIATWSMGHKDLLSGIVSKIGLPHFWVDRQWDEQLIELNKAGALNGHIPISAIIGCVGSITAILSGYRDIVVSNERAANEPTLQYMGVDINHQYSKSLEYEIDYQRFLQKHYGDSIRYYSFLRPLSELYVAELFAASAWDKYRYSFTSCNRAFRHGSSELFWCGECPKCAFVYMVLAPFIPESQLEEIFHKNLLLDKGLAETYENLLGISGNKPLECVGEIKESRAAMSMCQSLYPDLKDRFKFELDDDYDYRQLGEHKMPADIYLHLDELFKRVSNVEQHG